MTDGHLMDADCVHGVAWYECNDCLWPDNAPIDTVHLLIAAKRAEGVEPAVIGFPMWLELPDAERYNPVWIVLQSDTWDAWCEFRGHE